MESAIDSVDIHVYMMYTKYSFNKFNWSKYYVVYSTTDRLTSSPVKDGRHHLHRSSWSSGLSET